MNALAVKWNMHYHRLFVPREHRVAFKTIGAVLKRALKAYHRIFRSAAHPAAVRQYLHKVLLSISFLIFGNAPMAIRLPSSSIIKEFLKLILPRCLTFGSSSRS